MMQTVLFGTKELLFSLDSTQKNSILKSQPKSYISFCNTFYILNLPRYYWATLKWRLKSHIPINSKLSTYSFSRSNTHVIYSIAKLLMHPFKHPFFPPSFLPSFLRISLCIPWTRDPPTSFSKVLGLQACATTCHIQCPVFPGLYLHFVSSYSHRMRNIGWYLFKNPSNELSL